MKHSANMEVRNVDLNILGLQFSNIWNHIQQIFMVLKKILIFCLHLCPIGLEGLGDPGGSGGSLQVD